MSPRYPSTDPRLIRAALEFAETHTHTATAAHFGINHHSIKRWADYRAERHPAWPTDQDVANWDATVEPRARKLRQTYRCEQRRVLSGRDRILIPEHGTIRRLQALCALGWTQGEIATRLGVTRSRVSHLMRHSNKGVKPETAQAVTAVYDSLSMTVRVGREAGRMRRYAAAKGWAPPLAWDDETIDNAAARPVGLITSADQPAIVDESRIQRRIDGDRSIHLHKGEPAEVVRRMLADGFTSAEISRHTGIKVERYIKVSETREQVAA